LLTIFTVESANVTPGADRREISPAGQRERGGGEKR
jgi:hypothetical protein